MEHVILCIGYSINLRTEYRTKLVRGKSSLCDTTGWRLGIDQNYALIARARKQPMY